MFPFGSARRTCAARSLLAATALAFALFPAASRAAASAAAEQGTGAGNAYAVVLSEAERAWLKEHPALRLGIAAAGAPFDYLGAGGSHQGIAADYAQIVARSLGLRFVPVAMRGGEVTAARMRSARIDVIAAAQWTHAQAETLRFSAPYLSSPWAIVVPAERSGVLGLSDLDGKSVAVPRQSALREQLGAEFPGIALLAVADTRAALRAVERGQVFAAIGNIASVAETIQSDYAGRLKIASAVQHARYELRFALRQDWPELASAIDKVLAAIPEQEHRHIRNRWLAVRIEGETDWGRVAAVAGPVIVTLLAVMVVVLVANRRMRAEIRRRRVLEEALTENEERLRAILHSAPEGVITIDEAGRITYWNAAAERLFGYTEREVLGRDAHELLSPARLPADARKAMTGFAAGAQGAALDRVVEIEGRHKDGHEIPIEVARAAYRSDGERHAIAFVRDVRERRQAEAALLEAKAIAEASRRRLLDMSDALPCAVYQIRVEADETRRYTFVSKKVIELLGVDLDTIRSDESSRWRNVDKDDRPRVEALIEHVIRRHERFFCEYRVHLDGQTHWIRHEALPQRQSDGAWVWNGYWLDVTDIKHAGALVAKTERWYRGILETAPDGLLVVDAEGRITLVNAQIEELFGYPREELIGQPVELLVPERQREHHPVHRHHYLHAAVTRPMGAGLELYARRKDGAEFPVEIGLSPLPGREGEPPSVSASVRDISERKRAADALREAKERAEEATRTKSMFLANMSHEIRTPMNAIIGMAHLAQRTELSARQRDYIDKIHGAAISLLAILNDVLDFSKIEADKLEVERVEFSLDAVFDRVATVLGQRAADKGLALLFRVPGRVPRRMLGDPLRLTQVLTNLAGNAIKFTERGTIAVTVEPTGAGGEEIGLHFSVHDNGIGMSEEEAARLFQPFTQADGSTTRRFGGTGLGLTISKRLVELMGGRIWVDSAPDAGSAFHFTACFGALPAAPEVVAATGAGRRVLVADDHDGARAALAEALGDEGLRAEQAGTAQEALAAVRHADALDPYALVFLDWKMPGMDGVEAARTLKADTGLRAPPAVVLMSAFGHEEIRGPLPADGFLGKPFSRTQLRALLAKLGAGSRAASAEVRSAGTRATDLAGLRVLLAEDNDANRQVAAELLAAAGVSVDVAENGREALERLRAQPAAYDAVLMDVQMPEMDGYAATRALREEPGLAGLPVIATTAHALAGERERCLAAGMNDHLAKPIDPEALYAMLRRWCQPSRVAKPTREELGRALRSLARLLGENDSAAVDLFGSERARLRAGLGSAEYARIERAIRAFDFDTALARLKGLAKAREIEVE